MCRDPLLVKPEQIHCAIRVGTVRVKVSSVQKEFEEETAIFS